MSGRVAWLLVLALMLLPALALALAFGVADPLSREVLSWRPDRALSEPWRLWSAAWLHWSRLHLLANALGALLVGALGWVWRPDRTAAWAWGLAWPLTHLSLLLQPELTRYGGLSGVLHAGVAVVVVGLLLAPTASEPPAPSAPPRPSEPLTSAGASGAAAPDERARPQRQQQARSERRLGAVLGAGLLIKLLLEQPWGEALRHPVGWDIAVAPLVHSTGAFWGACCGALAAWAEAARR
ncbi:MAG: hypothetical protein AB9M60_09070 [Leptothrix sp. (in: b-proteobacteria)]